VTISIVPIDPVAVYAAIVATGALGWQVWQWRSERRGKLDVGLKVVHHLADVGKPSLFVTVVNSNDYPVRISGIKLWVTQAGGAHLRYPRLFAWVRTAGSEVPAHDSLSLEVHSGEHGLALPRGHFARIAVKNSLGGEFRALVQL
jgi:hypothetical protein